MAHKSMKDDTIKVNEFTRFIPDEWKPFIEVLVAAIPRNYEPIVTAWQFAINSLNGKIHIRRPVHVVFAKAPFKISLGNGSLVYSPKKQEVINAHVEDLLILLDCEKMINLPMQLKVACILEEFVHALMQVSDEILVSDIVALLYSGIQIIDGKYHLVDEPKKNH